MIIHGHAVEGKVRDNKTRCEHYHGRRDIIAIKFKCCQTYYPCYKCHQEKTNHPVSVWKKDEFAEKAILCGACGYELTIHEYLHSQSICPNCKASFNPNCKYHYPLYFENN
ncbi:CHY zinc finger protein [Salinibacillus aidingensis]|uniref:CHY zinc finger protein n=1 Tax=Salinibacillus aidingensis TaxID=237684 RepID=A0ABP3LIF7_9BACI